VLDTAKWIRDGKVYHKLAANRACLAPASAFLLRIPEADGRPLWRKQACLQ
jgi:hypothetical protein